MSSVSLNTEHRKLKSGERVKYWYLRWYGPDGRRRAKCIGRTDEVSKTKAHRIRLRKMADLEMHPGRGDITKGPQLGAFLDSYLNGRATEVMPATVALERTAGNYLLGYFGPGKRMGEITRADARAFKRSLLKGDLARLSKTPWRLPGQASVEKHVRHVRGMFARCVDDELVEANPFAKLTNAAPIDRAWPYIDKATFDKLLKVCPSDRWRVFLGLCRLAALRRQEALNLPVDHIQRDRLQVIAHAEWLPKDKASRWVPICPELRKILGKLKSSKGEPVCRFTDGQIRHQFDKILKTAKVAAYSKPFQSLRKSCIRDWSMRHPAHVVREWSGHASLDTMDKYYLQTPPSEFRRAARTSLFPK